MARWLLLCAFLSFDAYATYAQALTPDTSYHPVLHPSLDVHRRSGDITIDGNVDDAGWKSAAHTGTFTLSFPMPMMRPPVTTDAYVTYDDEYLYVAMIAHDPHPEDIRQSMIGRDKIFSDDFMGIILDSYGDAKRAFEIYINPRGIQGDLFWTATNEDDTYDLIYNGESKITKDGWQMEMRIPFRSLRFPSTDVQNFHIAFWRSYPREVVYKMSSSPIDFRLPCWFCQLGPLTGIQNIPHSNSLDLLPSIAATQSAVAPATPAVPAPILEPPSLTNDAVKLKPSLGLTYAVGPASSIEATINPDFSQVEADAAQVSVNTTFALYYPEHRPFFQDGSDLFNTYLSAIYTRSIDDPIGALKVLHRDPTLSVAYLGGYDLHSPVVIPLEEKSVVLPDVGQSLSNIVRVAKTVGEDSYIGALATDRRYHDKGSNTVAGLDARARLFENVVLMTQGLWSNTIEANTHSVADDTDFFDRNQQTVEYDGEHYAGTSAFVALERFTPTLDAHAEYSEFSPAFRAGNGSIFNNDRQSLLAWTKYKFYFADPPAWLKWLIETDVHMTGAYNWNFEHMTKLQLLEPQIDFSMSAQTSAQIAYQWSMENFRGIDFPNLTEWIVNLNTSFDSHISLNASIIAGRTIARTAETPFAGNSIDLTISGSLKPIGSLLIEPTFRFSQLDHDGGSVFYTGSIYRSRFTYQFTRELDARVIVQYDGFAQQFEVDPLITYKVNPFTSFYIGSTHDFDSMIGGLHSLQPTQRQFFAKVQYLIAT